MEDTEITQAKEMARVRFDSWLRRLESKMKERCRVLQEGKGFAAATSHRSPLGGGETQIELNVRYGDEVGELNPKLLEHIRTRFEQDYMPRIMQHDAYEARYQVPSEDAAPFKSVEIVVRATANGDSSND